MSNSVINMIKVNIKIEILKVRGNNIRIGIKAPDDVKIMREEFLFDKNYLIYAISVTCPLTLGSRQSASYKKRTVINTEFLIYAYVLFHKNYGKII